MSNYPKPPTGAAVRTALDEAVDFFAQLHCGVRNFSDLRHADRIDVLDNFRRECVAEVSRLSREHKAELVRADRQGVA